MEEFLRRTRTMFMVVAALAMVLAVSASGQAAGGGHADGGGHGEGMSHGGHDFDRHRSEDHHFDGRDHDHFRFAPVFPYAYEPYPYAPSYWYYCPSYGAYYPYVTSCPDAWEPVPAS